MMASTSGGAQMGTRNVPFTPIMRQNSIFSLTLDELQNAIEPGKHVGSMNMDEFLKNVWSAEENQAMSLAISSSNESNASQPSSATGGGLARQGSLTHPGSLSLSRTLSRKTVDEVWRDIHRVPEPTAKEQQRANNYGEMTLEDFLVKAGVVREDSEAGSPASNSTNSFTAAFSAPLASQNPFHGTAVLAQSTHQAAMEAIAHNQHQQHVEWHNYQLKSNAMQHQQHVLQQQAQEAAAAYAMPKRGPVIALPGTPSGSGLEGSSDGGLQVNGLSPAITTPDTPNRGRKRGLEALPEKTVERRQRRMIKNRESAARSRARKQAYTVELEAEVTQLKEENSRLRKEMEEASKRKREELLIQEVPPRKNQALRRSCSISW
ncbi:hypothetical protein Mapa_013575 [Marchantia paleacea]|nr:hypothetical protein Mapa_013575 [Marchantia paleacea]